MRKGTFGNLILTEGLKKAANRLSSKFVQMVGRKWTIEDSKKPNLTESD